MNQSILDTLPTTSRTTLDTFSRPGADMGVGQALGTSIVTGFQGSFTGLGFRAIKYFDLKNGDMLQAESTSPEMFSRAFVSREEWEQKYKYGKTQFEDNHKGFMSRGYAEELMRDAIDDDILQAKGSMGYHPTTQVAGNLFGGFVSPVDWGINLLIPGTAPVKWGMGATVASRSGIGVTRLAARTLNGAINGAAEGVLTQPLISGLSSYTQTPYTLDDAMYGIALGPIIGGSVGLAHGGYTHFASGGELDRHFANAVLNSVLTDKDPTIPTKVAGLDPRVKQFSEAKQAITEMFQKVYGSTKRTAKDMEDIAFMAGESPDPDFLRAKDMDAAINAADEARARMDEPKESGVVKTAEQYARPEPRWHDTIVRDMLDNPNSVNRDKVRAAKTNDEMFLADAWKHLFGQNIKFVEGGFSDAMGFSGFVRSKDPATAYIRAGQLIDNADMPRSMMFLAGHELGHSIRMRDPGMWESMVGAMMDTARNRDGALADAWSMIARHNNEHGAHAGLSLNGKMDETFATVLGQAATNAQFWSSLNASSSRNAGKFAAVLKGLHNQLGQLLNRKFSKSTRELYDFLGEALTKADADGRHLTDKITKDPEQFRRMAQLYETHKPEFRRMTAAMSRKLNNAGQKKAQELASFIEWHNELFPQVSELIDESGVPGQPSRYSTIYKNRAIDSGNPALWLLYSVYSKAKPGTKEHEAWTAFAERRLDWSERDGMSNGKRDYAASAMRVGPLVEFKKNSDGTWDIGVIRDEEFPRWNELFEDIGSETELVSRAYFGEELSKVREAFDAFISSSKKGDEITVDSEEFNSYLNSLTSEELSDMVRQEPDALWRGFQEHLNEKLTRYRMEQDASASKGLQELTKYVDDASKPKEEGFVSNQEAEKAKKAFDAAWNAFRREHPKIQKALKERDVVKLESVRPETGQPSQEFFTDLFKTARAEVGHEIAEFVDGMRSLQLTKEGKGLDFTIARAMLGDDEFGVRMNKAIDEMAHDRIRNSGLWPQYDKVMGIAHTVETEKPVFVGYNEASAKDLPPGYEDLGGFDDIRSPFADTDVNDMFSYMATTPDDVVNANNQRRMTLDDANRASIERLKRSHAEWSKWAKDPKVAADSALKERAEYHGVPDFQIEPKFEEPKPKAPGEKAPEVNEALEKPLRQIQRNYVDMFNRVTKLRNGRELDYSDFRNAAAIDAVEYHERQGLNRSQASLAAQADFKREAQAKALQEINNYEATKILKAKLSVGIDSLYSYLDGSARKGVKSSGQSVDAAMRARVIEDTSPLVNALNQTGLLPSFLANNQALLRLLSKQMKGVETNNPQIKQVADVLKQLHEVQVGRMNAQGANIRLLDGYFFSQTHSASAISNDPGTFKSRLNEWLDWEATERSVGPNMPDGTFNRKLYLDQLAHEMGTVDRMKPEGFNPETMGGNVANKVSRRRTLHFKDTFAIDYDMQFGSGNTAGLVFEQAMKRAEMSTVMDHFGSDYKKVWGSISSEIRKPGAWRFDKASRIDMTFNHLVGDLNHPADVTVADRGRAVRNYMNSVTLWLSGVSSVTDLGNVVSTSTWAGVPLKDLHSKLLASMQEHAKDPKDRDFLLAQGAGLQSILHGFTEATNTRGPMYNFASAASNFTFKYNGMEFTTRVFQSAFHDVMTQHLGNMAGGKITPEFTNWLKHYGITTDEWARISKGAAKIDGLEGVRLAPDMVTDAALAQKLRSALSDSVDQAVLQPSASDKALMTGGLKAGTLAGEAFRTVMQYKGYPLAMVRKVNRRFANAYGDQGFSITNPALNNGTVDKLVWAGSMLTLAAITLGIKDTLRGREPLNPFDSGQWNVRNASRIVAQAGVGPFAVMEQFLSPHQMAGPALGAVGSIAAAAVQGDGYKFTNAVMGAVPGSSIAPLKETAKALFGNIFTETYGARYQAFLSRNEFETGQSSIFQVDSTEK